MADELALLVGRKALELASVQLIEIEAADEEVGVALIFEDAFVYLTPAIFGTSFILKHRQGLLGKSSSNTGTSNET